MLIHNVRKIPNPELFYYFVEYIKIFKNIIFEIQTRQTDKVLCVKLNVSCYKSKKNIDSMLRDMQKCIEKFVKLSGLNNWLNEHRHRYRMSY